MRANTPLRVADHGVRQTVREAAWKRWLQVYLSGGCERGPLNHALRNRHIAARPPACPPAERQADSTTADDRVVTHALSAYRSARAVSVKAIEAYPSTISLSALDEDDGVEGARAQRRSAMPSRAHRLRHGRWRISRGARRAAPRIPRRAALTHADVCDLSGLMLPCAEHRCQHFRRERFCHVYIASVRRAAGCRLNEAVTAGGRGVLRASRAFCAG